MNCNCDHHETCAVCVPSLHGAKRATPHEQLIDELRDSTVPKTEREHAAAREIEKNQDRIAAGHRLAVEHHQTVDSWGDSMSKQIDFLKRCIALNLQSGGLLDLLDRIEELERERDTAWAQAHRLALELECLIIDTKDNAVVSKWWDSAFEAIEGYQALKPGANEEAEAWAKMRKAGV